MAQWLMMLKLNRPEMLVDGPTQQEMESVGRHFGYWQALTEQGIAILVGRTQTTDPDTLGLAVFRADSLDEAEQIATSDPGVLDGVFKMELRPYHIALLGNPTPFRPES